MPFIFNRIEVPEDYPAGRMSKIIKRVQTFTLDYPIPLTLKVYPPGHKLTGATAAIDSEVIHLGSHYANESVSIRSTALAIWHESFHILDGHYLTEEDRATFWKWLGIEPIEGYYEHSGCMVPYSQHYSWLSRKDVVVSWNNRVGEAWAATGALAYSPDEIKRKAYPRGFQIIPTGNLKKMVKSKLSA